MKIFIASFAIMLSHSAFSKDMNCSLQMTNDYVSDMYSMSNSSDSKADCLRKCEDYAKANVEIMADPKHYDPIMKKLSWKCNYNKSLIKQKVIR